MNKISNITKRDILQLFVEGLDVSVGLFDTARQTYPYYGRLSEIGFINRLYNLKSMPSEDSRFINAEGDIFQHTINNDDYPPLWIFTDERFHLLNGSDDEYLKFICEIFHPEVCIKGELCDKYRQEINTLINRDGYELYVIEEISQQPVYSYRCLTNIEMIKKSFVPFSIRVGKTIKAPSISKPLRRKILEIINVCNTQDCFADETGWQYHEEVKVETFKEIKRYYQPKAYDDSGQYAVTDDFESFILSSSPKNVFDVIEIFYLISASKEFERLVNNEICKIGYKLIDRKITPIVPIVNIQQPKEDDSLKGLLLKAAELYKENNDQSSHLAVEKLWDALERIKTYFCDYNIDKKKSAEAIVELIGCNIPGMKEKLNAEFIELTDIGNNYHIRHFERDRIEINDRKILDYLYVRCSALLNLTLRCIESNNVKI